MKKIYQTRLPYFLTSLAAITAALALIITLSVMFSLDEVKADPSKTIQILFFSIEFAVVKNLGIAFWTIGPPLWFWLEYFWLFKCYGDPTMLEEFKHGQHVSTSIWAGVIAFMIFTTSFDVMNILK